jgi:hypothetical protein
MGGVSSPGSFGLFGLSGFFVGRNQPDEQPRSVALSYSGNRSYWRRTPHSPPITYQTFPEPLNIPARITGDEGSMPGSFLCNYTLRASQDGPLIPLAGRSVQDVTCPFPLLQSLLL